MSHCIALYVTLMTCCLKLLNAVVIHLLISFFKLGCSICVCVCVWSHHVLGVFQTRLLSLKNKKHSSYCWKWKIFVIRKCFYMLLIFHETLSDCWMFTSSWGWERSALNRPVITCDLTPPSLLCHNHVSSSFGFVFFSLFAVSHFKIRKNSKKSLLDN